MFGIRFTVATYNLWATARWPEREAALRAFAGAIQPDILAVQELRPQTQAVLDEALADHARVDDSFAGWTQEGNVYWRADLFEKIAHGAEDVGIKEPLRRLFWVRLRPKGLDRAPGGLPETLLFSTAHFTWPGHPDEVGTGVNPRPEQARRAVAALERLAAPGEPVFIVGDFNEETHVARVLRDAGYRDSFRGRPPVPTHPAIPTARGTPQVIDWQFYRGPVRSMVSEVVEFYHGDLAPSDHKAVLAAYELLPMNSS